MPWQHRNGVPGNGIMVIRSQAGRIGGPAGKRNRLVMTTLGRGWRLTGGASPRAARAARCGGPAPALLGNSRRFSSEKADRRPDLHGF